MLFFGGAVMPIAVGLSISSVNKDMRPTGSSVGGFVNNFFGYFLGPMLCGAVAEGLGLDWGFRLSMGWSVFALFSMIWTVRAARRFEYCEQHLTIRTEPPSPAMIEEGPSITRHRQDPVADMDFEIPRSSLQRLAPVTAPRNSSLFVVALADPKLRSESGQELAAAINSSFSDLATHDFHQAADPSSGRPGPSSPGGTAMVEDRRQLVRVLKRPKK